MFYQSSIEYVFSLKASKTPTTVLLTIKLELPQQH